MAQAFRACEKMRRFTAEHAEHAEKSWRFLLRGLGGQRFFHRLFRPAHAGKAPRHVQRRGRGSGREEIPKDFSACSASSAFKRRFLHRLVKPANAGLKPRATHVIRVTFPGAPSIAGACSTAGPRASREARVGNRSSCESSSDAPRGSGSTPSAGTHRATPPHGPTTRFDAEDLRSPIRSRFSPSPSAPPEAKARV